MSELKHFGNSMFGPDKDVCQTCGVESNTMYWHNGVCQSCREKKTTEIKITGPFLIVLSIMMFPLAIIEILLNIATSGFYNKWMGKSLTFMLGTYIADKQRGRYS